MDLKTMYPALANSPETVTLGAIDATTTQVNVQDITKIPDPPNLLVLGGERPDAETVLLTAVSGATLTIQRGISGIARTWADRTTIARNFTSYDHDAFLENIRALSTAKADRATSPTAGHLAVLDGAGNPADSGKGLSDLVPATRKVNGKALGGDIALTAADVGARPSNWTPTAAEVGADAAGSAATVQTALGSHTSNKLNPHGVTAAQVGAAASNHTHTAASIGAATAAAGVYTLTHSKSGTVHALIGLSGATGILSARFKATAAFAGGNTFTIDGTAYTAALASGDALPDGAFVSGALVELLVDTSAKKLGFKAGGGQVGTLPSQSTITASAGNGQVTLTISRPNSNDYAGTLIVRKAGSYPTGPSDGTKLQAGTSSTYIDSGLSNGTTYYYRAFAYNSKKQYQTLTTGARVTAKPVSGIRLDAHQIGDRIRLSVGGTYYNFPIIQQGRPSTLYDTSCDGTWLLMEQIYENRQWNSTNVNDYANSTIKTYLDSTFYNLFTSSVRSIIKQVKIPYRPGTSGSTINSGSNGLLCKVFLLSGYEMGWTKSDSSYFPVDGAKLAYFTAGASTAANNKRIAYLNGSAVRWWGRSPDTTRAGAGAWVVGSSGGYSYGGVDCSESFGIRPCIILPKDTLTKATHNADGSYDLIL